jgi:hypothetical protein
MSGITCPVCRSPVSLRQLFDRENKPFCERCGWNVVYAEAALNSRKKILKFWGVVLAGVTALTAFVVWRFHENLILALPTTIILMGSFPLWHYIVARRGIAAAKSRGFPNVAPTSPGLDPAEQALRSLARPRHVKVKFAGTLGLTMVLVALILFCVVPAVLSTWHDSPLDSKDSALIPLIFLCALVAAMVVPTILRERRNWPLLRDGELTLGRVLSQQVVHQGRTGYNLVHFEFQTNSGQWIRNSQKDLTEKVFEDMSIPVFYDPSDPSKNVAICATYLRISGSSNL